MRVDIEHIMQLRQELKKINAIPLKDIEWYRDGKKLKVNPSDIEDFSMIGLNNTDFVDRETGELFNSEEWRIISKC